jgi:hypothetical protein
MNVIHIILIRNQFRRKNKFYGFERKAWAASYQESAEPVKTDFCRMQVYFSISILYSYNKRKYSL